jgi:hypothetical protein
MFRSQVKSLVKAESPFLRLLSVSSPTDKSLNTIVSIGVFIPTPDTSNSNEAHYYRCLTMDEAKIFHQQMTEGSAPKVMLGQPVKINDGGNDPDNISTVVRIALGADIVLQLFEGLTVAHLADESAIVFHMMGKLMVVIEQDRAVVKKMTELAKSFTATEKAKLLHPLACVKTISKLESMTKKVGLNATKRVLYDYSIPSPVSFSQALQQWIATSKSNSNGNCFIYFLIII